MAYRGVIGKTKDILARQCSKSNGFVAKNKQTFSDISADVKSVCTGKTKLTWATILFGNRWYTMRGQVLERITILTELFTLQCNAIAAQRVRRSVQVFNLYNKLYDKHSVQKVAEAIERSLVRKKKTKSLGVLFGAILFQWDKEKITEEEMKSCADEIHDVRRAKYYSDTGKAIPETNVLCNWEKVIDKSHLVAWRKPVQNSYLFEYKVYGTYSDIPARAFFNVQIDLEYRKQWDKLVIELEVIDRDEKTGCEVVRWLTHFPYPMYNREYIYMRKSIIDHDNKSMVLMSRSVDHPAVPLSKKYVRVNTLKSQMIIKPHVGFDENGFDYVLTYYDDPKSAFPTVAYNWMASTGVPEFVNKIHHAAKVLHERKVCSRFEDEKEEEDEDKENQAYM